MIRYGESPWSSCRWDFDLGYPSLGTGSLTRGPNYQKYKPIRPSSKIYRHILYCVPTFSNPSSTIMSLPRRQQLVRLARKHDVLLISDDVYDMLHWPIQPLSSPSPTPSPFPSSTQAQQQQQQQQRPHRALLPRLTDIDRTLPPAPGADSFGNAISNGSFSKLVAPGVRTGWTESSPASAFGLAQAGTSKSGGASSNLMAVMLGELLLPLEKEPETGGREGEGPRGEEKGGTLLEQWITHTLVPAYSSRFHTLVCTIYAHLLPLGCSVPYLVDNSTDPCSPTDLCTGTGSAPRSFGGYFIWLSLPARISATRVAALAKERYDVIVASGTGSEVKGNGGGLGRDKGFDGFLRLCFAWEVEGWMNEGVRRLAGAVGEALHEAELLRGSE